MCAVGWRLGRVPGPRAGAGVLVLLLVGLVSASCTGGDEHRRRAPGPVHLTAALKQFRAREADRVALVVLRNRGDTPVTVLRVRLVSPDLTREPSDSVGTVLDGHARVDAPVRYGASRCREAGAERYGQGALVRARVRLGGEPARDVTLRLASPDPLVRLVVTRDCRQRALARAADIRFGPHWTPLPGGRSLRGSVVVRRRDTAEAVTLVRLDGSVVFDVRPTTSSRGYLARLAPGVASATRSIVVDLPSCSAHVLIEAKKAYVFPMQTRVGDGPDVVTLLMPGPHVHDVFASMITRVCAHGE